MPRRPRINNQFGFFSRTEGGQASITCKEFKNFNGISCFFSTCLAICLILDLNIEQMFNIMIAFCPRLQSLFLITEYSCLSWIWCQRKIRNMKAMYWETKPWAGGINVIGNVSISEYIGRLRCLNFFPLFIFYYTYTWMFSEHSAYSWESFCDLLIHWVLVWNKEMSIW